MLGICYFVEPQTYILAMKRSRWSSVLVANKHIAGSPDGFNKSR
jgi:hypothetical protein